ncbi:MAG: CCA tRNA nucleotidyltransferase [Pirellulales bacterium]|nr:CCA tRNA nucleotidyltransferase [Pirellulales bacterium]
MTIVSLKEHRQLAIEVVERLRSAGYDAYWAGGCVRDQLLGREPKDYDVATSAPPDEIRDVFGRKRTLAIGAAFGVITVLGKKEAGMVEVATFRKDATYSDGRHPDAVEFTNAEEDARRRDFTINALFYDPVNDEVIDFVDGQSDIDARIVRAVGEAAQRIDEDKLRMLRAVRFAAVFDFVLESATLEAVTRHANEIKVVSAERIAEELRRMLVDKHRARAVALLRETTLLEIVVPELGSMTDWDETDQLLAALEEPSFPLAFAGLLSRLDDSNLVRQIARRLKLSNEESDRAAWLVENQSTCVRAEQLAWHQLQRVLIQPGADELVALDEAWARVRSQSTTGIELCRAKLALDPAELNPPPLITGDDLVAHGVPRGKIYRELLDKVRDAQLDGRIDSRDQALALVDEALQ